MIFRAERIRAITSCQRVRNHSRKKRGVRFENYRFNRLRLARLRDSERLSMISANSSVGARSTICICSTDNVSRRRRYGAVCLYLTTLFGEVQRPGTGFLRLNTQPKHPSRHLHGGAGAGLLRAGQTACGSCGRPDDTRRKSPLVTTWLPLWHSRTLEVVSGSSAFPSP